MHGWIVLAQSAEVLALVYYYNMNKDSVPWRCAPYGKMICLWAAPCQVETAFDARLQPMLGAY